MNYHPFYPSQQQHNLPTCWNTKTKSKDESTMDEQHQNKFMFILESGVCSPIIDTSSIFDTWMF